MLQLKTKKMEAICNKRGNVALAPHYVNKRPKEGRTKKRLGLRGDCVF